MSRPTILAAVTGVTNCSGVLSLNRASAFTAVWSFREESEGLIP